MTTDNSIKRDIAGAHSTARQRMATTHQRWRGLASQLGSGAAAAWRDYEAAVRELETVSNSAALRVAQLRKDDLIPAEGRRRLIDEALADGRTKRAAAAKQMQAARTVLAAKARSAALPRLDPAREMAARDELRLLADASDDPLDALVELAAAESDLAAVAVSRYGESYLRARGVPKAPERHLLVQDRAVDAAKRSNDPTRRAAAEAYAALPELDAAASCAHFVADGALDEASVEL